MTPPTQTPTEFIQEIGARLRRFFLEEVCPPGPRRVMLFITPTVYAICMHIAYHRCAWQCGYGG
jgi:hypothetical protein